MISPLQQLKQPNIFSQLDLEFARVLSRLCPTATYEELLAAALTSHLLQHGHICLNINAGSKLKLLDREGQPVSLELPAPDEWLRALRASELVATETPPPESAAPTQSSLGPVEFRPLVLDRFGQLYLWRYHDYQARLLEHLIQRFAAAPSLNEALLRDRIEILFPRGNNQSHAVQGLAEPPNLQRVAALISARSNFSVLCGGPGTGKTTTVVRLLACIIEQSLAQCGRPPKILLLAPTGKAAQRMLESVRLQRAQIDSACGADIAQHIPKESYTIHRALGFQPRTPTQFRYHAENQLPVDCVVVDETSMVDLALLTKLVEAVPLSARLILVGDPDQLASVESGAIFGDLIEATRDVEYSEGLRAWVKRLSGDELPPANQQAKMMHTEGSSTLKATAGGTSANAPLTQLKDSLVKLERTYRQMAPSASDSAPEGSALESRILKLARAINREDYAEADDIISASKHNSESELSWISGSFTAYEQALAEAIEEGFRPYLSAHTPAEKLIAFARFRLLTPHRSGPQGVDQLNHLAERILSERRLLQLARARGPHPSEAGQWYEGRPILITQNDYQLELFNGDTGILARNAQNKLMAYFPRANNQSTSTPDAPAANPQAGAPREAIRAILPARLPPHQTVFAMTIHKSQGSEFEQIALVLPDQASPLLNRQLIYTAITRAKRRVQLFGQQAIFAEAIRTSTERHSGLAAALRLAKANQPASALLNQQRESSRIAR